MDRIEELSALFKNLMSRSAFCAKYRIQYYRLTEAIEDGRITTYCIDSKVYVNVDEAFGVLGPFKRRPKKAEPASELKNDLFA